VSERTVTENSCWKQCGKLSENVKKEKRRAGDECGKHVGLQNGVVAGENETE